MDLTPEQNAELDELNALGSEAAQVLQSGREPSCVARAFRSKSTRTFVLTMQGWIDLAAIESPVLQMQLPGTLAECAAALECFGASAAGIVELTPEEALVMGEEMVLACAEAFSMRLKMRPPGVGETAADDDGMGEWLPVWSSLVTQCGLSPEVANALAVGRAFALIAGLLWHRGWKVADEPYALREVPEEKEEGDE